MDKGMVLDHNDIDGLIAAYDGDAKALIAALLDERKIADPRNRSCNFCYVRWLWPWMEAVIAGRRMIS